MRKVLYKKSGKRLFIGLLFFLSIPLLSSLFNVYNASAVRDVRVTSGDKQPGFGCWIDLGIWLPMINIKSQMESIVKPRDVSANTRQLSARRKIFCISSSWGKACGFTSMFTRFGVLFVKPNVHKPIRHLIVPHSTHAPPHK